MTVDMVKEWQRIQFDSTPIYVRPDAPDWFVPNETADELLVELMRQGNDIPNALAGLLKRIDRPTPNSYESRSGQLGMDALTECWFHVTNRCNLECKHCMFESSPRAEDELAADECAEVIREAYELGCRLYYFTGGEPLLSKTFFQSARNIMGRPDTHVVVLTNLSLLPQRRDLLREFPRERLHFQVSVDGLQANHDSLRGRGAFRRLSEDVLTLGELGFPATLSMTVTKQNIHDMERIIDFAAEMGISNVHYLWLFRKGNADEKLFVEPEYTFSYLTASQIKAEEAGVKIDNIESLRSQVFSCPGTRYDLSNAGWQSLAVGPDGNVYPTPALVYDERMICGHISQGLQQVWRTSHVLDAVRHASLNESKVYRANPFRYIVGGGDIDHSYIQSGDITGGDPYVELYNSIVKWLIAREARKCRSQIYAAIKLKMGEKLGDCPAEGGSVFFTHSNCVLSLAGHDTRTQINRFYSQAAEQTQEDILNPISYEDRWVEHIPADMRYRSYGCGSPVLEADIQPGETVLDLGSGTGIECFIASKTVGIDGRVIGIDMSDAMLAVANRTKIDVVENLQYDNIDFKKSFLESLPLEDESVDLVLSNCVLNLSSDKRKVFSEIFRVLRPEGRLVVADITHDDDIPLGIKYNEKLRGECIGGSLSYHDLFGILNDIGFSHSRIVKAYLYREVNGYDFYSVTYEAMKPAKGREPVLYDFPEFGDTVAAVRSEPTCACFVEPEQETQVHESAEHAEKTGCMVCGADISYFETHQERACHYCGNVASANAQCTNGHFVCDSCHRTDAVDIIRDIGLQSREVDAATLMQSIRSHPHFRMHGPEHHSLVPAVVLIALRNAGYDITDEQVTTGIERGQTIAGGACAFMGVCGAAVGVGIAFSVLLSATPYDADKRQAVQRVTQSVLGEIASYEAPRCCQRDCWIALSEASRLLEEEMGKTLTVKRFSCEQYAKNEECIHDECPLWPRE
jgi:MoaA/NifB/PqqE/SkfB family radical SAM enzyme/ubiquinone/menaquinone biosynthesis C-methylase UbiE